MVELAVDRHFRPECSDLLRPALPHLLAEQVGPLVQLLMDGQTEPLDLFVGQLRSAGGRGEPGRPEDLVGV